MEKEIVGKDEFLIFVNEVGEKDRTIEDLRKDCPDEIEKLKQLVKNNMSENDLKIFKTELPDKCKFFSKKLTYPFEYFNSIDDYQKPVEILKKEDFLSKLKNINPSDEEMERLKKLLKNLLKMENNQSNNT